MKFLIAGCGYVGSALGRALSREGHEVLGIRRNAFSAPGIQALRADLSNPETLQNLPDADIVIFSQAPSKDVDSYRKTYLEATENVLAAIKSKPQKLIFISSTSVYGVNDGSRVDEKTDPKPADENAKTLLEAERAVLSSRFPSIVLRLAGIYGPDRNRLKAIRSGEFKPVFDDTIYTNRIHLEDIVSAIRLLAEKGKLGEIYLGSDDYPCTQKEFYEWLYAMIGIPVPDASPKTAHHMHRSNKRCSNAKIKALGLQLKYPTFKEGYGSFDFSAA